MRQDDPLSGLLPMPTDDELLFMSDELAELRGIIQRNEAVVVAGGPIIAWWGVCNALAGLWNFVEQMGHLPVIFVGPINALAGYIGSFAILKWMRTASVLKVEGQAIVTAWVAVAVAMPLLIIGCMYRGGTDLAMISGLQFLFLGMATAVSGMGSRKRWLLYLAAAWLVLSAIMFFVITPFWRPLLFSGACLALLTIPGIYLFMSENRNPR